MSAETFDARWTAEPENVATARRAVVAHLAAAKTSDPPLSDIGLAVSEAATNVVQHAYRDRTPGEFRVRVEARATEVELMVQDDGLGMTPRPDSPGLGLGMPLIATVADRIDVQARPGGGTRLCAWFSLDPTDATLPG